MKSDFFNKYLSLEKTFHVEEKGFTKEKLNNYETLFTLGNGLIGSRGIYEENTPGSQPGTFVAGIYDRSGAQVEELVNLPNPINIMIAVEGEKFDIGTMNYLCHRRILDMKNGVLLRSTVYEDAKKRKYLYQSARFFSMADPHIGALKVKLSQLKGSASLTMVNGIDDSVFNSGGMMLSRRRHFDTIKVDKEGTADYTLFSTHSYKNLVSYADLIHVKKGSSGLSLIDRIYWFELKKGQNITFTKYFTIGAGREYSRRSIKSSAMRKLSMAVDKGYEKLFSEHKEAMSKRWKRCDVEIEGDSESQRAVRFNIYHILICTSREYSSINSIGAKTMSGQGYRGHVFWDTELYILPFLIHTQPEIAKEILMFRCSALDEARANARKNGFRGAMYPWETTVSGTEQTPRYAKDVDGSIVEVTTMDYEHHITADVAYGIYDYYQNTDDEEFMIDHAVEVIFETARFWSERASYDSSDNKYHVKGVTGPDEFHTNVDDNAFTNYMAMWNLRYGREIYEEFKDYPKIKNMMKKIDLKVSEVLRWGEMAENFAVLRSKKLGIIKQFRNYLRKKDVSISGYDRYFMPQAPKIYETSRRLEKSRFIKQADVLLLFNLFPSDFSDKEKKRNYSYYVNRTLHKSSLSYSMHSLISSQIAERFNAFNFFWGAANIDLKNIPKNLEDGIHAANLGGVWQAVIFGFAGVRCREGILSINPVLPGNFKRIRFSLFFRKSLFEIEIRENKSVSIKVKNSAFSDSGSREIKVYGRKIKLKPGECKEIRKDGGFGYMETAKDMIKPGNDVYVKENEPVKEVGKIILERKVSSIPVVDEKMKIEGVISERDIIKAVSYRSDYEKLKAKDIMSSNYVSVDFNESIEEVTKVFTGHGIRRLPVIEKDKVIGVIDRRDIIADYLGGYY